MRTLLFSIIAFVTFIPVAVFAQQNLVNLPIGDTNDFNDYINAVYLMFISIAALIAVVKIIIAGVKYMFSDIVTQKSDAKRDIQGALLGLLVVLSAVVVLTIINPDLTRFNPEITGVERAERSQTQTPERAIDICTSSDACKVGNCLNTNSGQQGGPIYDCTQKENECLGRFIVDRDESRGYCIETELNVQQNLNQIANEKCPAGRSCLAERIDCSESGFLQSCSNYCTDTRNGVSFVDGTSVCVTLDDVAPSFDPESTDQAGPVGITIDPNTTYTLRQNADQQAENAPVVEITIADDQISSSGFITVILPDGSEAERPCGSIVPNVCP